ncbi:AAA domain-containing protein [Glycomyces sp. NPDC046736]|uniref:DEAD/DEAH box helicase n=1 Tax=Glycomyces sp. NPDC046736 TaxID=3155615 RepID=UPI0033D841DA
MRSRDSRSDIVRYWRDVEIFEPQRVPRQNPRQYVYDVVEGEPLPWEGDQPAARRPLKRGERWRYMVYCGVFPLDATFDVLSRYCGQADDAYDARGRGEAALAGFELDSDGRLLPDSAVLSSSAWGLGRVHLLKGMRPGWSDGLGTAQRTFTELFDLIFERRRRRDRLVKDLLGQLSGLLLGIDGTEAFGNVKDQIESLLDANDDGSDPERSTRNLPMDHALLEEVRNVLLALTGTTGVLPQQHPPIRIACKVVRPRDEEQASKSDFLNSFIAEDLSAISHEIRAGHLNGALDTYLREAAGSGRIDVRNDLHAVYEATRPSRIPLGRWPAPPAHSLALGQQLAVNNAIAEATARGEITGVNGPPGTGKTTLLRDMFAALITERARRLADLARPGDGFVTDHQFTNDERRFRVPQLRPELCGYEITVASSNNGAVQNVTAETPHLHEIDERWRGAIDYFSEIGQTVLNATRLNESEDEWEPAWSLMAAVLGNAENRGRFSKAFWFGLKESRSRDEARPGMLAHLKSCRPERTWAEARKRFKAAESKVLAMAAERERHFRAWQDRERYDIDVDSLEVAIVIARQHHEREQRELGAARARCEAATAELERTRSIRDDWDRQRPGLLLALLRGGGELRDWRQRARTYVAAANDAWDRLQENETQIVVAERAVADRETTLADIEADLRKARAARERYRDSMAKVKQRFGRAFPELGDDRRARELCAPWCDEEFNAARSELFLESLRLHRAFIEHNAAVFRRGLGIAVDVVNRSVPPELAHETRLAAWQLLFLAVPVVSTTFASVARQFDGLSEGDLGWLFIDEAGQATPQAAVGAIWRSSHVMAVGDPLQLEPVLSLPHTIQQSLREHYGLSDHWLPGWTSVQGLADAHTRFGTTLPGPDAPLWVGSPLTVHRRCDEPMFSISNEIAYDGLMINDTPDRGDFLLPKTESVLTRSMWLDVRADGNHGHWIPAEGERLDGLLAHLRNHGFDMGEVMVITPFREVAAELNKRRNGLGGAGTVHTAQGKQADIVILVLGGDPAKPRAGGFAAEKPNFVNVAVSRAKRRLYVIGNHETWSKLPNFAELAATLGSPK